MSCAINKKYSEDTRAVNSRGENSHAVSRAVFLYQISHISILWIVKRVLSTKMLYLDDLVLPAEEDNINLTEEEQLVLFLLIVYFIQNHM